MCKLYTISGLSSLTRETLSTPIEPKAHLSFCLLLVAQECRGSPRPLPRQSSSVDKQGPPCMHLGTFHSCDQPQSLLDAPLPSPIPKCPEETSAEQLGHVHFPESLAACALCASRSPPPSGVTKHCAWGSSISLRKMVNRFLARSSLPLSSGSLSGEASRLAFSFETTSARKSLSKLDTSSFRKTLFPSNWLACTHPSPVKNG